MKLTPAMQQYVDIKKQYSDCILLFRLGDFYEVIFEDAKLCSSHLDLVLTSKNKKPENPIPMAWMPHHSAEKYIEKLIQHGYKVAVAEQVSDPKPGQLVEREVKQVHTPGTYIQDDAPSFNYVCALTQSGSDYHIAWWEFSLGQYYTKSFTSFESLQKFLLTLSPSECLFASTFSMKEPLEDLLHTYGKTVFSVHDIPRNPEDFIAQVAGVQTVASFGQALSQWREQAFALLAYYLHFTQKAPLHTLQYVRLHNTSDIVLMDDVTVKNLEIFHASYEHDARYSLFGVINNTRTAAWSRLLHRILQHPTQKQDIIAERLGHVAYFRGRQYTRMLHQQLSHTCDIQKTVGTIVYRKTLPVLFARLRKTFELVLHGEVQETWSKLFIPELYRLWMTEQNYKWVQKVYEYLLSVFKDDEDLHNEKNFIRDGYDAKVDELRKIAFHADEVLLDYQTEVQSWTDISCKLKFVSNQGYFVEVSQKDVPAFEEFIKHGDERWDFVRRHTLKAAQRYTSPYLEQLQIEILQSRDKLIEREQSLLMEAKEFLLENQSYLADFSELIAWLDVYSSHALLSIDKKLVAPTITTDSTCQIDDGRHLVIEEFLPRDQDFIPNNIAIWDEEFGDVHIITWPNMWGKSTFLRQNALIVLMAHCGLYIPAKSATIGLVDGIFARVGSGDIIAKNQSTFMTEMIEVANILHNATGRSFVIFDELGRGTSTYDGMALTKTILEYIVQEVKCRTLLATHYHELVELEHKYTQIKNFSVSVYENNKEVVFMKKIVEWGANKSYGIDVAQLAGLPAKIIDQARKHLASLENKQHSGSYQNQSLFVVDTNSTENETPKHSDGIINDLENIRIEEMTPVEALVFLEKLKKKMS